MRGTDHRPRRRCRRPRPPVDRSEDARTSSTSCPQGWRCELHAVAFDLAQTRARGSSADHVVPPADESRTRTGQLRLLGRERPSDLWATCAHCRPAGCGEHALVGSGSSASLRVLPPTSPLPPGGVRHHNRLRTEPLLAGLANLVVDGRAALTSSALDWGGCSYTRGSSRPLEARAEPRQARPPTRTARCAGSRGDPSVGEGNPA